jgi:hypothetical protein
MHTHLHLPFSFPLVKNTSGKQHTNKLKEHGLIKAERALLKGKVRLLKTA